MDSKQRVIAAFERRPTDRPPIFPVVTLVHAAKLIGKSISEIGLEPRLAYDALYKAWEVYGFDGFEIPALDEFPLFAEKLHPLWENETLYFVDDAQNKCYYFQDLNDQPIKLNNRVYSYEEIFAQPVRSCEELLDGGFMDPVRDLIQRVDGRAFLAGHVPGQTFNSLVAYRGSNQTMLDIYDDPDLVFQSFELFNRRTLELAKAFAAVGIDAIYIGDAWSSASIISPAQFEEFCLPYYKRMAGQIHEMGLKAYLHICGNSKPILEKMAQTGVDAIEPLDPLGGVRLDDARDRVGNLVALKGGVNTLTLLSGTADEVERETRECLEIFRDVPGYIFGTGDDIPRDSPVENVLRMCDTVRAYAAR